MLSKVASIIKRKHRAPPISENMISSGTTGTINSPNDGEILDRDFCDESFGDDSMQEEIDNDDADSVAGSDYSYEYQLSDNEDEDVMPTFSTNIGVKRDKGANNNVVVGLDGILDEMNLLDTDISGNDSAAKQQKLLDDSSLPLIQELIYFIREGRNNHGDDDGIVLFALKMSSGFNRLLSSLLKNNSLVDWVARKEIYNAILDLLLLFCESDLLVSMLQHNPGDGTCTYQHLLEDVKEMVAKEGDLIIGDADDDVTIMCQRITSTCENVHNAIENCIDAGIIARIVPPDNVDIDTETNNDAQNISDTPDSPSDENAMLSNMTGTINPPNIIPDGALPSTTNDNAHVHKIETPTSEGKLLNRELTEFDDSEDDSDSTFGSVYSYEYEYQISDNEDEDAMSAVSSVGVQKGKEANNVVAGLDGILDQLNLIDFGINGWDCTAKLDRSCLPLIQDLTSFIDGGHHEVDDGVLLLTLKMSPGFNRLLTSLLRNNSITEWVARKEIYSKILDMILLFCESEFLVTILQHNPGGGTYTYQHLLENVKDMVVTEAALTGDDGVGMCQRIISTCEKVRIAVDNCISAGLSERFAPSDNTNILNATNNVTQSITRTLSPPSNEWTQFIEQVPRCTAAEGICDSSVFRERASQESSSLPQCIKKLLKELDGLNSHLPTEPNCSIWVRFDEDTPQFIRALVAAPLPGPTPYSGGLFAFDIWIPHSYPHICPEVKLLTTGGGRIRFGPNLYADGTVCLSLLGTWNGPGWDPMRSSLYQVLMSIQGMILGVEHPYYLEPGFGGWEGDIEDKVGVPSKVTLYDDDLRVGTAEYAMARLLRKSLQNSSANGMNELEVFRDIIKAHFSENSNAILAEIRNWISDPTLNQSRREAIEENTSGTKSLKINALQDLVWELEGLLRKVGMPQFTNEDSSTTGMVKEEEDLKSAEQLWDCTLPTQAPNNDVGSSNEIDTIVTEQIESNITGLMNEEEDLNPSGQFKWNDDEDLKPPGQMLRLPTQSSMHVNGSSNEIEAAVTEQNEMNFTNVLNEEEGLKPLGQLPGCTLSWHAPIIIDGSNEEIGGHALSDDDDRRLFEPYFDKAVIKSILRTKQNDPELKDLMLNQIGQENGWGLRVEARLGQIIGNASCVESLHLQVCRSLNMRQLGVGLQFNKSIKTLRLSSVDLWGEHFTGLVPFLANNPCLEDLTLEKCNLGPAQINLLSDALLHRSANTLTELNLSDNPIGDIDLDKLVFALGKNENMDAIRLSETGIGARGCASLADLLGSPNCKIRYILLFGNSINSEAAANLADSLARNTTLKGLYLDGNYWITADGWLEMLRCVFNSSSIKDVVNSNHTIQDLCELSAEQKQSLDGAFGVGGSDLLHASLQMNSSPDKKMVVRSKILWSHARGDLNIGDSSIANSALPCILGWISDDSNEPNAKMIQYNDPPLPKAKIDAVRLVSVYRLMRTRPSMFDHRKENLIVNKFLP